MLRHGEWRHPIGSETGQVAAVSLLRLTHSLFPPYTSVRAREKEKIAYTSERETENYCIKKKKEKH